MISYSRFVLFKDHLATQNPLYFHINLVMDFSTSEKKNHWDFCRDCIEFVDHFE